ncbi:hypothetical protein [Thalassobaculum sp.]|uniref:hypothetical protein n=1 Tax=Thalassobaculum sp. TaxID=2022740 RepID=UPI003B59961A
MTNDTGPAVGQRVWAIPAILLASLAVVYLRGPDAFLHPNFWAEDGNVFFAEWQRMGLASLLHPYNGYLHLAPRLVAAFAGAFPLEHTVLVYLVASQLVALWCAVTIYLVMPARGLWPPLYLAPFLAIGGTEVLSSPTNLQWILAVGLIAVLLAPVQRAGMVRINAVAFVVLAGLSGPFSLFALAATVAVRMVLRRMPGPGQALLIVTVAGTAALQALAMSDTYGPGLGGVTAAKLYEAGVAVLRRSMGGSVQAIVVPAAVLAAVAMGRDRIWRAGLVLFALILTLSVALRFGAEPEVFPHGVAERYYYVQSAMWLLVLLSMLGDPDLRRLRLLSAAALVLMGVSLVDGKFVRHPRLPIDDWRMVVEQAGQAPTHYRYPPGWSVIVHPR